MTAYSINTQLADFPKPFRWPLTAPGYHVVAVRRSYDEARQEAEGFALFKKKLRLQQGLRAFETDTVVRQSGNFFHVLVISKARRGKGQIVK